MRARVSALVLSGALALSAGACGVRGGTPAPAPDAAARVFRAMPDVAGVVEEAPEPGYRILAIVRADLSLPQQNTRPSVGLGIDPEGTGILLRRGGGRLERASYRDLEAGTALRAWTGTGASVEGGYIAVVIEILEDAPAGTPSATPTALASLTPAAGGEAREPVGEPDIAGTSRTGVGEDGPAFVSVEADTGEPQRNESAHVWVGLHPGTRVLRRVGGRLEAAAKDLPSGRRVRVWTCEPIPPRDAVAIDACTLVIEPPPPPPTQPPQPPEGSVAPRGGLPVVEISAARYPCQSEVGGPTVPGSDAGYAVVQPDVHSEYVMGCVRDAGGRPLARALVVSWALNGRHIIRRAGARTGPDGRYANRAVSGPGWWEVVASAPGYEPQTRRVLAIQDRTALLDFVLEPKPGGTPTPVP